LLPILFIAFYLSVNYLQSADNKKDITGDSEVTSLYEKRNITENERNILYQKNIQSLISQLNKKIDNVSSGIKMTEDERNNFIIDASKNITDEAISLAFKAEAKKLSDTLSEKLKIDSITEESFRIASRLSDEIRSLRVRSTYNLAIGMSITVIGLIFLWSNSMIIENGDLFVPGINSAASVAQHDKAMFIILSRVSIVILIEVFAYFFLRLYKQAIVEIKIFQNELTNLESKLAAVKFSMISNCSESIKASILELSKTERNFILKKSQTSVELERAKSETKLTERLIKIIPEISKRAKD